MVQVALDQAGACLLCVGVNDASVSCVARPYMDTLVTQMYHHVRLNDVSVDWT